MKYTLKVEGYIQQGNRREHFRNHFFGNGLYMLSQLPTIQSHSWFRNGLGVDVGTDTSTITTFNTSGNTSSVNHLAPSYSVSSSVNGSQLTGTYTFNFPVSALPTITIGELTLLIIPYDPYDSSRRFYAYVSRTSVADGDFSPFSYNPANGLVIVWNIVFGFQ